MMDVFFLYLYDKEEKKNTRNYKMNLPGNGKKLFT